MTIRQASVAFVACLLVAAGAQAEEGVIDKTGAAVKHGAQWTAHKIERGAKAAGHGIKVGVDATAHGVKRGAEATSRVAHRIGEKIGGSNNG